MGTVVAVFAHPDDETFIIGGSLAKSTAMGHRVVLVCATKGEMGRRLGVPPTATRETVPFLREKELLNACDALGIATCKFLGIRDKTLEIQPFDGLVDKVYEHLVEEKPQVVITFHEEFGGHPDHCIIGAATTRAFARYAETVRTSTAREGQSTSTGENVNEANPALLFVAWGHMHEQAPSYGLKSEDFLVVNVKSHLREKMMAYRAHQTQSEMMKWLWTSESSGMKNLGDREYYIQAIGRVNQDVWFGR